jgi:hypothetical protein
MARKKWKTATSLTAELRSKIGRRRLMKSKKASKTLDERVVDEAWVRSP